MIRGDAAEYEVDFDVAGSVFDYVVVAVNMAMVRDVAVGVVVRVA